MKKRIRDILAIFSRSDIYYITKSAVCKPENRKINIYLTVSKAKILSKIKENSYTLPLEKPSQACYNKYAQKRIIRGAETANRQ